MSARRNRRTRTGLRDAPPAAWRPSFRHAHPRSCPEHSAKTTAVLALHLPLDITVADLAPAVTMLFSASQGQLHLRPWPLEVDPGRDQSQAAPLAATDQTLDLVTVKEQLAGPLGIVIGGARRSVGRDVGVAQPHLAALDYGVGVAELRLALAQRLDLGAEQLDPALEPVEQLELLSGAAVGGDIAGSRLAGIPLSHRRPHRPAPGPHVRAERPPSRPAR